MTDATYHATHTSDVYVFDAYGTLFDVHAPVSRLAAEIGPVGPQLSAVWRERQLEYTWVLALAGRYRAFEDLTADALDFAISATCAEVSAELRARLLAAYRRLDAYPEVQATLASLKAQGKKTAILSNGIDAMLNDAVAAAGLAPHLDATLSVETVGVFKTDPRTYRLVIETFATEPHRVAFQSSNRWDIAGAKSFGFRCHWINRTNQPDEYPDLAPDAVLPDLKALTS